MKVALLNIACLFVPIFILIFGWEAWKTPRVYFDSFSHPTTILKTRTTSPTTLNLKKEPRTEGMASWYNYSLKGYPNYSKENFTAASRDYPKGTMLRVCRTDKKFRVNEIGFGTDKIVYDVENPNAVPYTEFLKCIKVRVNDYGPEHCADNPVACPERVIDLSSAAFEQLAPLSHGVIEVEIIKL